MMPMVSFATSLDRSREPGERNLLLGLEETEGLLGLNEQAGLL